MKLPELGVGCFFLDVSMPAPIKFMIFSICYRKQRMGDEETQGNNHLCTTRSINEKQTLPNPLPVLCGQPNYRAWTLKERHWARRSDSEFLLLGVLGWRRAALQWWITSNSPMWTAVQWLIHHSAKTQFSDTVNYNPEVSETLHHQGL